MYVKSPIHSSTIATTAFYESMSRPPGEVDREWIWSSFAVVRRIHEASVVDQVSATETTAMVVHTTEGGSGVQASSDSQQAYSDEEAEGEEDLFDLFSGELSRKRKLLESGPQEHD